MRKSFSDSLSQYCAACRAHLHSVANLRTDHQKLIVGMQTQHAAEVASIKANVERRDQAFTEMTAERDQLITAIANDFLEAPSEALQALISNTVIGELQEKERVAYRTRDRAMAAVWRVSELHSPTLTDKCKCGKALAACREYQSLEFFWDSFDRWERHEVERMKDDKPHGLPLDHPKAQEHFTEWIRWKGARSTRSDDRRN